MSESYPNLLDLLQAELVKRCQKNPKYSLRAFATALGFSSSFLSKLLSGKRPLTAKTAAQITERLHLTPMQAEFYQQAFKKSKQDFAINSPAFRQINLDQFQLISDWYHFAILELITLDHFDPSPTWIAKKLQINVNEAKDAIERLIRLGYIKRTSSGFKASSENNTIVGPEIALPAATKQQSQFLERAMNALNEVPIELRSQSAVTMAIPASRLPEAKEIIAEFRRKMASVLQRSGSRDAVYQLSVSFFPLTPNENPRRTV